MIVPKHIVCDICKKDLRIGDYYVTCKWPDKGKIHICNPCWRMLTYDVKKRLDWNKEHDVKEN